MRVFLGLTEVSGFFTKLAAGLKEIGVDVVHVPLQSHSFAYAKDANYPWMARWARSAVAARAQALSSGHRFRAQLLLPYVALTRVLLFLWVLVRFDVIVLGGGSSFFNFREFPLLKLFNKKLIYTLHGTDIRPPYIDGFFDPAEYRHLIGQASERAELATKTAAVAALRRKRARTIEENSTAVLCSPNICHFLSKPFVSFYQVGLPVRTDLSADPQRHKKVRPMIVHAPSQRKGKGSDFIRLIVEQLAAEGLQFDYREVTNLSNQELLGILGQASLVIDQAYSDAPVAGLAAEASALGVPVVVGGYYASKWRQYISEEVLPPVVFCRPEHMKEEIRTLLSNAALRENTGEKARQFVATYWNEASVAKRFLQVIKGAPAHWYVNPKDVFYHEGIGLSEDAARANVRSILEGVGKEGLQLGDNLPLERSFVEFATHAARN